MTDHDVKFDIETEEDPLEVNIDDLELYKRMIGFYLTILSNSKEVNEEVDEIFKNLQRISLESSTLIRLLGLN